MAWRGMMAHFKDVGLGRGQTWVALLERMGEGEWDRERERERDGGRIYQPTAHSEVSHRPPKGLYGLH